jgi:hypothetical protein
MKLAHKLPPGFDHAGFARFNDELSARILTLFADGQAEVINATPTPDVYRWLHCTNGGGQDRVYLLYKPGLSPIKTFAKLLWFLYEGKPTIKLTHWWLWRQLLGNKDGAAAMRAIPSGCIPIGLGAHRIAWLTVDGSVVVIGPCEERPKCPHLLQPFDRKVFGTFQLEWFPYVETKDITMDDVNTLKQQVADSGWLVEDWHPGNVGRLADGTLVRIDPDRVYPPLQPA